MIIRTAPTIINSINNNLTISTTMSSKKDMMLLKTGHGAKAITNLTQINSNSINTMITIMTNNIKTENHNILTNSGISPTINTPINSQ